MCVLFNVYVRDAFWVQHRYMKQNVIPNAQTSTLTNACRQILKGSNWLEECLFMSHLDAMPQFHSVKIEDGQRYFDVSRSADGIFWYC